MTNLTDEDIEEIKRTCKYFIMKPHKATKEEFIDNMTKVIFMINNEEHAKQMAIMIEQLIRKKK